ncbi:MAG: hydantoinase B/oxoprolinase family protein, partial [Ketobacteraceae bacterium]|nr:hydantoinase B/oxoprolinase family protein [Ketobacteraceae bacterium]
GGTHLPDITLIAPVFNGITLMGFVANRAHHANVGGSTPGSMPISRHLEDEGILISPTHIMRGGRVVDQVMDRLARGSTQAMGDFSAQISANRAGARRLEALIEQFGVSQYRDYLDGLNDYGRKLAESALADIPAGRYEYTDFLDDDSQETSDIRIQVAIEVSSTANTDVKSVQVDFTGTDPQVPGNINCPLSVAAAAVFYVFRCLMPPQTPACAGTFSVLSLEAPKGCLLNAEYPAAVAAGNVETSTRAVDAVLGALAQALPERIPAASHGSMNNVAMGAVATPEHPRWDYYETIGGGMGASRHRHGVSAVQTHMTNTLNTPVESVELHYPLRVTAYGIRRGSGGQGKYHGGDGIIRELEFLAPAQVTLLTERRVHAPWGLGEAASGAVGVNLLNGRVLPGKTMFHASAGDCLRIETPGGGGCNA